MKKSVWRMCLLVVFANAPLAALADPPNLQTPAPVIYLADNDGEPDGLGWCIDTLGRGLSDRLHAHSCKPQGGDVQFAYDVPSKQIRSVAFEGLCMQTVDPDAAVAFHLLDCVAGEPDQRFDYDASTMTFHPEDNAARCVVVGADIRNAGPFSSRDLILTACDATDPVRARWVIAE